ncbi:MAG: hypothetical protein GY795_31305 [Desulfobacterales bacterium]|nr:hypothetical protein [Desulfobacterales bacterium]
MAHFKIQARVLDLLGEQQIADCPTAISELFKNAYDACAQKAMLDVYSQDNCALLWDDGIGMSEKDIVERWLVVGTSNKSHDDASVSPEKICGRTVQGEKGIGRLAISTIGESLLLISRSKNLNPDSDPYTALFINWNVARNDFLMLEDIEVPVITFSNLGDLDTGIVNDMVEEFRKPIVKMKDDPKWKGDKNQSLFCRIMNQLDEFKIDMPGIKRSGFQNFEHGTLFYIQNILEQIPNYVQRPDRDRGDEDPNMQLIQLLNNFQNNFESPAVILPFEVDVRRWDANAKVLVSIFQEWEAFTSDDLEFYDHYIDMKFDEWGQYRGTLKRYQNEYEVQSANQRPKRPLTCGPFHLRVWYWQGEPKETTLAPDQYAVINEKVKRFGGIIIYRDGLRVLPYGKKDIDWLLFEERRSKGAWRYFFSYRRMFGYVVINKKENPKLKDKAGREGLINNPAYRQFRNCLIEFFSEIARTYFGKTESFREEKEVLRKKADLW